MRTTLTLDDDVAAALERLRRTRRGSFRDLVNEALREGLKGLTAPPRKRTRFLGNVDNVAEVLAVAEGDSYK
jgi:hypothetical protein